MGYAEEVARDKSTCFTPRRKTGCVIYHMEKGKTIATGWNGSPTNEFACDCLENCIRDTRNIPSATDIHITRAIHAEVRAVLIGVAGRYDLSKCALIINRRPCSSCLKLLIYVGIRTIYYKHEYRDPFADELLRWYDDIKIEKVTDEE
jgi:deoxycytidylate deaminase